ncbi:MAG: glycosyltransferase [Lentisphaerae bacterium]|nr:glycosyltransferase [Lentisphaerota bacterium]
MTPITVVHSYPVWLPLTQTWMHNLVRSLPPAIESHVVCERTENLTAFGVPHLHSLAQEPAWRRWEERVARRLRWRTHLGFLVRVLRGTHAPILHSHFGTMGWFNLGAARRAGARHVVTFYGADISQVPHASPLWRARYLELFAQVDAVLCEGPHMAACAVALGCSEGKVHVQRLGVALDALPFRPRAWDGQGPLRLLVAATFREKKGVPYAIAAAQEAARALPIALTVIGDAASEPASQQEKARVLAAAADGPLAGKVVFLGFQSHARLMEEAYRHHVFVTPSVTASDGDTEGGCPVGLIELAASGMPVVSSRHGDIPDVLSDRVSGLLATERSVPEITAAIRWLAAHHNQWAALAGQARAHIESHHDLPTQGRALAERYRALLAP